MKREIIQKLMQSTALIQRVKCETSSSLTFYHLKDVLNEYGLTEGNRIYGEDDGSDTDLVQLVYGDDEVTIAVWANVSLDNNAWVKFIDLSSVDIIIEGELYDCIDLNKD